MKSNAVISRTWLLVAILVVLAIAGSLTNTALNIRYEARRWRETQKAGGVPRFWERDATILQTLMNPPGRRYAVTRDDGTTGYKLIESHGFAEDADLPRAPHHRIFCLGDSVTYGMLPNSECYPDLLEGLLKAQSNDCDVVNAGRGGESTYTALLRYRYVTSAYDADRSIVGWFAGNEPVEMRREGIYNGPRVERDAAGWTVTWEDGTQLQHVAERDVQPCLQELRDYLAPRIRPLREPRSAKMAYLQEGSTERGVLSRRYALYGGTSFISAYYFLRYEKDEEDQYWDDVEAFAIRTLAVIRAFRDATGNKLVYVMIPEAFEVDPARVRKNDEYKGLLNVLELEEGDLSTAAYLRGWVAAMLRREGVQVVDPLGEMKLVAPAFRRDDLHPTRAGNMAIAEALSKNLFP